jgi:phenylacetate-CoA ligase
MAGFFDRLYDASPVCLQQVAVAAWGAVWYYRRFGGSFARYVEEFRARDGWTPDQFGTYQLGKLDALLQAAWNSPYYRRVFEEAGIGRQTPAWEALPRIPCLTKDTLRAHARELLTAPVPRRCKVFRSSGTTGTPVEIYFTPLFHNCNTALAEARSLNYGGVKHRDRRVMFGVRKICRIDQDRPPFWRFSPAENMAYASVYHLSPRNLPHYLKFLRRYRPALVMGYPSALSVVARYALANGDMPAPARLVVTTSETVTDQAREAIEKAWQCRLLDRYGAVEGCVYAGQCQFGRYHVSPDFGILEILDAGGKPCPPGELGEVVCTGLNNTLQPLIRYRLGDMAKWAVEQHCACGRSMPVLEAIAGRWEDLCVTPGGRQVLRFDTVFKGVENIREAQILQDRVDRFVIRVVPDASYSDRDSETLADNMRKHVGKVEVVVIKVPAIERSSSGKFRAVVCKLSAEEKRRIVEGASAPGTAPLAVRPT